MRLSPAIAAMIVLAGSTAALAQETGPSTTTPPYILPSAGLPDGAVRTLSLLSAGDSIGGYRMVGVPDGLGAWIEDGQVTLMMGHELTRAEGIARAHGAKGSFVSRYTIDPVTLSVLTGRDHNTSPADVYTFDKSALVWLTGADAWERLCSGDLAAQTAFQYRGFGTAKRMFLDGEETRVPFTPDYGRAYAHVATGPDHDQTWELPALGRMSYENLLANPLSQLKTIVMAMDDGEVGTTATTGSPSEVYMYVGTKKKKDGTDIEKAGLTGGTLYGIQVQVDGVAVGGESNAFALGSASFVGSGRFVPVSLGDVTAKDGSQLQADTKAAGVTRFQRTEDGAWDARPGFENNYYFVTTATATTNSRLWHLQFDDIANPELGGTIEVLLNGTEGHRMLDNITIDPLGRIIALEDVGNNARLGRVWMYDTTNKNFVEVAIHDAARFAAGSVSFLTQDEETSGVIPAFDLIGPGWYLLDDQAHYPFGDPEIVEGGQLLALYVDPLLGR